MKKSKHKLTFILTLFGGAEADVVPPTADLSEYSLVISPAPIVTNMAYIENLKNYVKNGGNLLGTFLTSEKDYDNVGYDVTFPAHLTYVYGVSVKPNSGL